MSNNISVVVHKFRMGDVEDPELYAAEPLYKWEKSEVGQWVMKNSIEQPRWNLVTNPNTYGYEVIISATFKPEDYTFWKLKND